MKILFLSRHQNELLTGGIAEVISQLSYALPLLGTDVMSYSGGSLHIEAPAYLIQGTPGYTGPHIKPGLAGVLTRQKNILPLAELVKKHKVDIVHTCGLYRTGYVAMHLKKRTGTPYILTSHSDVLSTSSDRIKRQSVRKRCKTILQYADAVTHLTDEMADMSHEIYDTRSKSHIIPNGIDLSAWEAYHQHHSTKPLNYLLALGRLVPEKGFHVLIDAFDVLLKQGGNTTLVIAGSGRSEKELFHYATSLGLNTTYHSPDHLDNLPERSVCFLGYVEGQAKKKLFCQSQFVLFATQPQLIEEAFGLVPFEAIAAKKILVASNLSRIRQLKKEGFSMEIIEQASHPASWAERIHTLLKDQSLYHHAIEKNYRLMQQFDWMLIAKQYQQVYENVLNRL